ncbi:VIT1/CCC1 transporter family protein [Halococcus dombrowskii]|uniref:VIT1/CCC1 transporter family protein n=1 Tax=Halococcus dombrowskii TaxID=179637 RepID=A0AAV3SFY0_HALDO|nr:VIT1/CCC1 transporter family protein [Halococcus dombrowskii]UOO94808.1 VIT1/CCC1 transporter family protein [Halococcus dombrowskii]
MADDEASLTDRIDTDMVGPIARRYFVSNGFDGALTGVGVTVGAYLSGISDGLTVISLGLAAAVGLTTSGVWSVWEIERAEMRAEIQETEEAMLADLSDTRIERDKMSNQVVNALMSGLGPLLGLIVPLTPFLFEGTAFSLLQATLVSVAMAVGILFSFGAYMASISRQRWYIAGIRMGLAGIVVAVLNVFLPG